MKNKKFFMTIQRDASTLATAKIGFLGTYFAFGSIQPYYGMFLASKHFAPDAVGLINSLLPMSTLVLLPYLAILADRHRCNAHLVLLGSVLAVLPLFLAAAVEEKWIVTVSMIIHFIGTVPIAPFMDQRTLAMLPEDRRGEWGLLRSYGTCGWAIGAQSVSCLLVYIGYSAYGIQFSLGVLATLYCMYFGRVSGDVTPTEIHYTDVMKIVFNKKKLLLCWLAVCFMGMGYVFISTFLFVFLRDLGASTVLCGLSVTATTIFEIPLFRSAKWLHGHFTNVQLITISMIAWVVRVFGYSMLTNPWFVFVFDPLHGLTFGALWLAGVNLVQKSFPPELSSSSLGFLSIGMFGIGPILGNIVGGFLYKSLGARDMFRVTALFMAFVCILFHILLRVTESRTGYDSVSIELPESEEEQDILVELQMKEVAQQDNNFVDDKTNSSTLSINTVNNINNTYGQHLERRNPLRRS